jgi:hypothetical protein
MEKLKMTSDGSNEKLSKLKTKQSRIITLLAASAALIAMFLSMETGLIARADLIAALVVTLPLYFLVFYFVLMVISKLWVYGEKTKRKWAKALAIVIALFVVFRLIAVSEFLDDAQGGNQMIANAAIEIKDIDCASDEMKEDIRSMFEDSGFAQETHAKVIAVQKMRELYLSEDGGKKYCHGELLTSNESRLYYFAASKLESGDVYLNMAELLSDLTTKLSPVELHKFVSNLETKDLSQVQIEEATQLYVGLEMNKDRLHELETRP